MGMKMVTTVARYRKCMHDLLGNLCFCQDEVYMNTQGESDEDGDHDDNDSADIGGTFNFHAKFR